MWSKAQTSFNAGELSPYVSERSDIDKYQSGCGLLENFIAMPYGGVYRRPGTCYVATTKGGKARLLPFNFSTGDAFALELGNLYMRFHRAGAGSPVLVGTVPYEIVTPWSAAQLRGIQYVQLNDVMYMVHPEVSPRRLSRTSDTSWTLTELFADDDEIRTGLTYPPFQDTNTTETTVGVKSGTFATWDTAPVAPAYDEGKKIEHEGVIYISTAAHTGNDPTVFQTDLAAGWWRHVGYDSSSSSYDIVTLTSSANVWDDGTDSRLIPVGSFMEVSAKRKAASVSIDITANGTSDILTGVFGTWNVRTYGIWKATLQVERSYDGTTWETVAEYVSAADRNVDAENTEVKANAWYRLVISNRTAPSPAGTYTPRAVLEVQDQKVAGVVRVLTIASKTEADVEVLNLLYSGDATTEWREAAWNSNDKYPRVIAFHEQRLYFGGTFGAPQTLTGSEVDNFEWFKPGGTEDADPVTYSLASGNQNVIEWMTSRKKLMIGTSGGEWTLGSSAEDVPLTPSNVVAKHHSAFGSKHVQAIPVNEVVFFTQRSGRKIRQFSYSFENDGYVALDVTRLAEHMTKGEVVEWAYQSQRDQILWCVTGDGTLAGLTYELLDNVLGWHRHTTEGKFESVCSVYGERENDELWVIVNRVINGVEARYVERMETFTWDYDKVDADKGKYVYLDSARGSSTYLVMGEDFLTFGDDLLIFSDLSGTSYNNLSHLEGKVVGVLADGGSHPDVVVGGGTTTLTGTFDRAVVGLTYSSRLQPMRLVTPAPAGTSQGRERKVHELILYFYQTLGGTFASQLDRVDALWLLHGGQALTFGTEQLVFGRLGGDPIPYRLTDDRMDASPPLFTGEVELKLPGGWKQQGTWELRTDDPFPMTLLSAVTKFNIPSAP